MLSKLPYRKAMPKIPWQLYKLLLRPAAASWSTGCRQGCAVVSGLQEGSLSPLRTL